MQNPGLPSNKEVINQMMIWDPKQWKRASFDLFIAETEYNNLLCMSHSEVLNSYAISYGTKVGGLIASYAYYSADIYKYSRLKELWQELQKI